MVWITDLNASCRSNKRYQKSNRAYPYIWTFRPESSRSSYCLISSVTHTSGQKFQSDAFADKHLATVDCSHRWKDFLPDAWKLKFIWSFFNIELQNQIKNKNTESEFHACSILNYGYTNMTLMLRRWEKVPLLRDWMLLS